MLLSICLNRTAQAFDHIGNIAGNGRPQKFVIHALVPRMRRDVSSRPQRTLLDRAEGIHVWRVFLALQETGQSDDYHARGVIFGAIAVEGLGGDSSNPLDASDDDVKFT